jgi:predicted XRE-type DNA-binding protein
MARRESNASEKRLKVVESSRNVFADFGFPDAEELQTKVKIAVALNTILSKMGDVTQAEVADRLNTDQPKVSNLKKYKLDGLSVERLLGFLTELDYDIDINIRPAAKRQKSGRIQVKVSAA